MTTTTSRRAKKQPNTIYGHSDDGTPIFDARSIDEIEQEYRTWRTTAERYDDRPDQSVTVDDPALLDVLADESAAEIRFETFEPITSELEACRRVLKPDGRIVVLGAIVELPPAPPSSSLADLYEMQVERRRRSAARARTISARRLP